MKTKDAGLVCRRCGISRPTLRLWVKRFEEFGVDGLSFRSKRPHRLPVAKATTKEEQWIVELCQRRLGSSRIQSELLRLHGCLLAHHTIQKVLDRQQHPPLKSTRRPRKVVKRYAREVPGERVQLDTCEIGDGLYQYTAIDDCTRFKVLALYPEKSAA